MGRHAPGCPLKVGQPGCNCGAASRPSSKAKHIGGITASTVKGLADGLLKAAVNEAGHVNREELTEVCTLVLDALSPACPCGFSGEPWHFPRRGVCSRGMEMTLTGPAGGAPDAEGERPSGRATLESTGPLKPCADCGGTESHTPDCIGELTRYLDAQTESDTKPRREITLGEAWYGTEPPEIFCPACGETVRQTASDTLSLALWQHWHWVCSKGDAAGRREGGS